MCFYNVLVSFNKLFDTSDEIIFFLNPSLNTISLLLKGVIYFKMTIISGFMS